MNRLVPNEHFLKAAYRKALIPCVLSILSDCLSILADGIPFDPIHSEKHDEETFMGLRMIEKLVEEMIYRKVFGVNTLIIRLGVAQ